MGWGDEIVAAGQAQRLYDADPATRIAIVDQQGFARWHDIWDHNPILARPSDVARGEVVRKIRNGPNCRPYIVYPFSKESGWTFDKSFHCRDHVARIYLTAEEIARGTLARAHHGPYVLIEPFTKHDNFRWPMAKWRQLVAACSDLTFVQHIHTESPLVLGAFSEAATFREACGLLTGADAYVRSESGMCHAAAALGVPQVTIFGGCMDPEVMGGYPLQTVLAEGPPCGAWLPCSHCEKVMERLTVGRVIDALRGVLRVRKRNGQAA